MIVGNITFKLKRGTCYLNRIEVFDEKFAHIGLGTQILKFMEETATDYRCFQVEGKFYPFGEFGAYAKSFYIKNGYEIYKEDYETYISKSLIKKQNTEKSL